MVTGWRFVVRLQHRPHTLSQRVQFIIKHIHGEIGESVHLTYEHSTISWQQLVKNNTRKFRIPRLRSISIYLHHGGVVFRGVTAPRVELPEVGRAQRFNLQLYVSLELDSLVSVSRKLEHALAVQHQTCDTSRHHQRWKKTFLTKNSLSQWKLERNFSRKISGIYETFRN